MINSRAAVRWFLPLAGVVLTAAALAADSPGTESGSKPTYTVATNGLVDNGVDPQGNHWKLLLNESNLGGKELEMAELTLPAGTAVRAHQHGAVEVIYVLSGVYGHEVNGKLYLLKPGMVGIVRPGDHVRHLVPKEGDARVLIIWSPPGEAAKFFQPGKGVTVAPVPEAKSLEP